MKKLLNYRIKSHIVLLDRPLDKNIGLNLVQTLNKQEFDQFKTKFGKSRIMETKLAELTNNGLISKALSFKSGCIFNWWDPIFSCWDEFRASLDFSFGGLKRETVWTNQSWLSFNFFVWTKHQANQRQTEERERREREVREGRVTRLGGRSEEREAFSSSVRRREKGSHQREGSRELGFAMGGAWEALKA